MTIYIVFLLNIFNTKPAIIQHKFGEQKAFSTFLRK
jgi:hypothetical protein